MSIDIEFNDFLINEKQAEIFAYNIYRDIEEFVKGSVNDFIKWSLEKATKDCVQTLEGIKFIKRNNDYKYKKCYYA